MKWLSLGFGGAILATGTTGLLTLSDTNNLREVEIIFYDKNANDTKKVKVLIDSLGSTDYFKYHESPNSWKYISYHTDANDKKLYEFLGDLAAKFIKTQHTLNVIKQNIQSGEDATFPKDNQCCPLCSQAGASECKCKEGQKCCYMCLGCYSDNAKPDANPPSCCCKTDGSCTWTKFKQNQKTFYSLMKNINGAWLNTYFSPIQANIKFIDVTFDEIKTQLTATQNATEYKPFVGSLTYGFVDYWYRQTTYKKALLSSSDDPSITDNSKDVYFSTVPQKFSFPHKLKKDDDIEGDEALKKGNIDAVWKKVSDTKKLIDQYKKTAPTCDKGCCCQKEVTQPEEALKCLLARNYVFLSKDSSDIKVADTIKNMGDCCTK